MPGRKYQAASSSSKYPFSINGQLKENDLNDNITTALYWEYDSRIGRRWNVDPKPIGGISVYNCFSGNPILKADMFGDTSINGQHYENFKRGEILQDVEIRTKGLSKQVLDRIKEDANVVNMGKLFTAGMYEVEVKRRIEFTEKSEATGFKEMLLLSRYKRKNLTLKGNAIELIAKDDEFKKFRSEAITVLSQGVTNYTKIVELGGERNSFANVGYFLISPLIGAVTNDKTLKVASNELTWMLRHATITATAALNNGQMTINYHVYDQFDLSGSKERKGGYNFISNALGAIYHGVLDNSAPIVEANWIEIINK